MKVVAARDEIEVVEREEVFYACGCSTVRIERRRQAIPFEGQCAGHGQGVVKVVRTIEHLEPPNEADLTP